MKEIFPKDALNMVHANPRAVIVDVRSEMEWAGGVADVNAQKFITITSNEEAFVSDLEILAPEKDVDLLFICKSGARSAYAASVAEKVGYKNCYNIIGGVIEWVRSGLSLKAWSR